MFVSGPAGIASARALIESPPDTANLAPGLRQDIVVYYSVSHRDGGGFGAGWERSADRAAAGPADGFAQAL
jgi:hypothetical protein